MGNPDPKTILLAAFSMVGLLVLAWVIIFAYEFTQFVSSVGEKIPWVEANPVLSAVGVLITCGIAYAGYVVYRDYY